MARKWVFGMAASLGAISAVGIQAAALAISPVPPTLKATPQSVMVNTNTTITGRNFTPGSSVPADRVLGHDLGRSAGPV